MSKRLLIFVTLILLQLILLDSVHALTYDNISSAVINKLPAEWNYILNSNSNIIQNSISDCRGRLGSVKYFVSNDSGVLLNMTVNSYLSLINYMGTNNYTGVARSYGLLVCYVSALADPLRLVGNTTKDLISTYEYFVNTESFTIIVGAAESVSDVRTYLKNFAMYSYGYFDVVYKGLVNIKPGLNVGSDVINATQILLNKAATVVYSLMIKAINDHRMRVLPIGIAWIVGGVVIGIIIVKREKIFQQLKR
jgi:hypothetical protein